MTMMMNNIDDENVFMRTVPCKKDWTFNVVKKSPHGKFNNRLHCPIFLFMLAGRFREQFVFLSIIYEVFTVYAVHLFIAVSHHVYLIVR